MNDNIWRNDCALKVLHITLCYLLIAPWVLENQRDNVTMRLTGWLNYPPLPHTIHSKNGNNKWTK